MAEPTGLKFCKDCRWFYEPWFSRGRCLHPVSNERNGKFWLHGDWVDASEARFCRDTISTDACGVKGALWEPKRKDADHG
jgi:hypothetical protein